MAKYRVFHNWGHVEGWKPVNETDFEDIFDAVQCREDDIRNGGGEVIIVEVLDTFDAYSRAHYSRGANR